MNKKLIFSFFLKSTFCFSSDLITLDDMKKINDRIRNYPEPIGLGYQEKLEKISLINFESPDCIKFILNNFLSDYLDSKEDIFYDNIDYFEKELEKNTIAFKDSRISRYFYYVEGSIFFLRSGDFEKFKNKFAAAQEYEKILEQNSLLNKDIPKTRKILSYLVTTSLANKEEKTLEETAYLRSFAQLYEEVRKNTLGFTEFDAVDCINLASLYYVGKDYTQCLEFSTKALSLEKWASKTDPNYLLRTEKSDFFKNILDILYQKGDYEEFKKLFYRTELCIDAATAQTYFSLAHIQSFEKEWEKAFDSIKKAIGLMLKGQTVYIKDMDAAVCIARATQKSKIEKEYKKTLMDLVRNSIPKNLHAEFEGAIKAEKEEKYLAF